METYNEIKRRMTMRMETLCMENSFDHILDDDEIKLPAMELFRIARVYTNTK